MLGDDDNRRGRGLVALRAETDEERKKENPHGLRSARAKTSGAACETTTTKAKSAKGIFGKRDVAP